MKAKHQTTYSLETLKKGFEFTDDDLAANRNGYMTDAQKVRLKSRAKGDNLFLWFATAVLAYGTVAVFSEAIPESDIFRIIIATVMALLTLWCTKLAYQRGNRIPKELQDGTVAHVKGEINLRHMGQQPDSGSRFVIVGGVRFNDLRKEEYYALQNGKPYGFYYTPKTNYIVSVYTIDAD